MHSLLKCQLVSNKLKKATNSNIMRVGIIRYPGSNCDYDTLRYFDNSFFIWHQETKLPENIDLLVIPGGFAFGDRIYNKATEEYTISPGEMAINSPVTKVILEAAKKKIPILGICNGFQILIHLGLLAGQLVLNKNKKFICKKIKCNIICHTKITDYTELYIANSYGRYISNKNENNVFLKYDSYDEIGSDIAGIHNNDKTIFGMMPHPERNNNDFKDKLVKIIFSSTQELFDTQITKLLSSEHISYKSTREYLKKLPISAPWVIQGPGENAGIVDIGDDYCIAIRIESHNHPTFIHPYEGAATGVGGIMRDIFTMGARPIAILDFLRFGTDKNSDDLLEKTIEGISYYGNCVGVPNVGGDLYRSDVYNKNPLVNIGCLGLIKKENIIYGHALKPNLILIYVGSKTGAEGINGAAMASQSFSKNDNKSELLNNIQTSDPFLEKLLLEACCEIAELKLGEGMQDMGAGGLLCASYEVVHRGREKTGKNMGCHIDIDKIPVKYQMNPCDILISESQERMLIVCSSEKKKEVFNIFNKWDLEYSEIGEVTLDNNFTVWKNNQLLYLKSMDSFEDIKEIWKINPQLKREYQLTKVKNALLWQTYDTTVGNRTLKGPDKPGSYAILDIYEIEKKLILTWGSTVDDCLNQMNVLSAKTLCIVNCLNFGHPKNSMGDFSKTIDNMISSCTKHNIPVVGGNVSLYNSTDEISIPPTPVILMLGIK